jgi:hypothetical protein
LVTGTLGVAVLASSARAQTAAADDYISIVLDQTGSMNDIGVDEGTGVTSSLTMFDNAVSGAQNWVSTDQALFSKRRRAYAIFTFKDDTCCGGTQGSSTTDLNLTQLRQVWPRSTSPDCNSSTHGTYENSTGYCLFNANDVNPYAFLLTTLDGLRPAQTTAAGPVGGDPNGDLLPIQGGTGGATFDTAAFGLGPNTPLADSFCDALERLQILNGATTKQKIFIFESDGGEDFSTSACSGPSGGLAGGSTSFSFSVADIGLTAGSWQDNTMRRATRLVSFSPVLGGLAANQVEDKMAINKGAINYSATADNVPPNMAWRFDIFFSICDSAFPALAPCNPITPAAALAQFAPAATASAAPAPTITNSISADELEFFTAAGHVNSKSSFRAFTRDPRVKFGTTHKLAGDVDDSGCVDHADFSIVTQSDVYFQRAVQPLQIAIRADLNADGWVNRQDAAIVLANWGKGCINPVGPKPAIP